MLCSSWTDLKGNDFRGCSKRLIYVVKNEETWLEVNILFSITKVNKHGLYIFSYSSRILYILIGCRIPVALYTLSVCYFPLYTTFPIFPRYSCIQLVNLWVCILVLIYHLFYYCIRNHTQTHKNMQQFDNYIICIFHAVGIIYIYEL